MIKKLTVLTCCLLFAFAFSLSAQTLDYKSGVHFPTEDEDPVLNGLKSVRGSDAHPDPIGSGAAGVVVTNYADSGHVHVFKFAGNDSMELVWTSPTMPAYGSVAPRFAAWGDLDNDGIIEIIVPHDINGILIYEWDGVADSWNFGTQPSRAINSLTTYPVDSMGSYSRVEYLEVGDFDGDDQNELIVAANAALSAFDRYYIFSVSGNYSTNSPGFSVVTRENNIWAKGSGEFGVYGGGSPYAMMGANLDGQGNDEIVIHPWNYGNVIPVTIPAPDTYVLADTTGGSTDNARVGLPNHFIYSKYPTDAVSLGGGSAFDIDGDGREEVYIPLYGSDISGEILMVHYEEGDDLSKIDSSNVFHMDLSSVYGSSSLYGRPGIGDYDDDFKPNIYTAGRHNEYIVSSEFQGGDKTDPANWIHEIIYTGDELDSKIWRTITIKDSAGVVTADTALQEDVEGTIGFKISANYSDFDKDGYEDMVMPTQAWLDSVDVNEYTWLRDTAYTVYDTSFAGTDSMEIDTVDIARSVYDTLAYKIEEPTRIGVRFLESSVMATGLERKELTVITPRDYKLRQNYPNPFNPETTIEFVLPIRKKISLTIYNSIGQKIKTLINNETFGPGSHEKLWDGTNDAGVRVATGMYVYELSFGNFTKSRRMMLIK